MLSSRCLPALALCLAVTGITGGCVSPMACGPTANGPIALGHPCDGCGQCDGCGELYFDPWINHPPDCCDPCDKCGNYNGQSCGRCRSVFAGVKTIWGYRCDDGCDSCGEAACGCEAGRSCGPSCGGCDACLDADVTCGLESSCGIESSCGMEVYPGGDAIQMAPVAPVPMSQERAIRILPDPTPARAVTPAQPLLRPYPQGVRRIYKARTDVAAGESITRSH